MKVIVVLSLLISAVSSSAFATVSSNELSAIAAEANTIGTIDAGSIAVDLAKARGKSIPGVNSKEWVKFQSQRPELTKNVRAALEKIKASQSRECFFAAAAMTRDVQGEGLASGLRMMNDAATGLFSAAEFESLEYLRVASGNAVTSLSEKQAQSACSK